LNPNHVFGQGEPTQSSARESLVKDFIAVTWMRLNLSQITSAQNLGEFHLFQVQLLG
jgi:hypothetical protein